jgi:hypothetical protein
VSMGGRAEGLACADRGARTPIGASGNFYYLNTYMFGIIHICDSVFACQIHYNHGQGHIIKVNQHFGNFSNIVN